MLLTEKMQHFPFSPGERVIIDYLLTQKFAIATMTSAQIAEATFSSKSSLVRIAKKLDCDGWTALKNAFLDELDYVTRIEEDIDANYPFNQHDDALSIANKLAHLEVESIKDTLSLLDQQTLTKVIDVLFKTDTIHLFAVSNNIHNMQQFAHNMNRIQADVRLHSLQSEAIFNAYLAKKNSCAIIVTYSGETTLLLKMMKILKRQQIPIILLTSLGTNSATKLANHVLRLTTREKLYSKIATFSIDTSISYLMNVLYSGVFAKKIR